MTRQLALSDEQLLAVARVLDLTSPEVFPFASYNEFKAFGEARLVVATHADVLLDEQRAARRG